MTSRNAVICGVVALISATWSSTGAAQDAGAAAEAQRAGERAVRGAQSGDAWPEAKPGSAAFEVPPVRDRALGADAGPRTAVLGFRVSGVKDRPDMGITGARIQSVVDTAFARHLGGPPADPAKALYDSQAYAKFSGVVTGQPAPDGVSLGGVLADVKSRGEGRNPDLHGLSASELAHIDGLLKMAESGKGARTQVAEVVAQLRARRHEFTVGQMQLVANSVTEYYRKHGLFLAQAFVPAQTVGEDRVVEIQVLEGVLGNVVVEGNSSYSGKTLSRKARTLVGTAVTKDDVESALLRTNDNPGVRVFGTFRPGAAVGESELVLQVIEEDAFDFMAGMDNYGTEFTGELRGRVEGNWNNAIGQADKLSLSAFQSMSPANNFFARIGYQIPLGASNTTLGLSASQNDFDLNEDQFAVLDIAGDTTILRGDLDWQIHRTRFFNSHLAVALSSATSELSSNSQNIQLNDDKITKYGLEWGMDHVDTRFNGINVVSVGYDAGSRDFLNAFNQDDSADFGVGKLSYSRLQAMPISHTILLRLRAQFSGDPLSSLEQFSLAGPDAVRAYPVSEILSDEGYFVSLEYRIPGPSSTGPWGRSWRELLRFDLFADYAYGSNNADEIEDDFSESLSGVGVGVRFTVPGKFESGLQFSTATSDVDASDGSDSRVYADLSYHF